MYSKLILWYIHQQRLFTFVQDLTYFSTEENVFISNSVRRTHYLFIFFFSLNKNSKMLDTG